MSIPPYPPEGLLVDGHVHVFKQDMPLIPNPRHNPDYSFTVEDLIAAMDKHGVRYAAIAAASPWGDYNDYVIESIRGNPRLRGTIITQPSIERVVLDQMDRDGIVGVRLPFISMKELPDLDSWDYRKFLRRLVDLDWHVHLHIDGPRLPQVLPYLEKSGVKIVIDHIGRPDPVKGTASEGFRAMVESVEKGRTWVKLSGAYRLGDYALGCAQELCRRVGYDKMLWASDCPFVGGEKDTDYRRAIDWLKLAIPDEHARRQVYGANGLAFYFT
ncbi:MULTISPECIES: amidohydrolase [unclassified Achromobacter]|uniref:amidohydrolase family protein n=1 Tax=unclassified Achromobacter TaxID=2626865 RepID=UPI000B51D51E|nr:MULTISPECIES: amidohydrolase family protein [unclassified Achromobacter]OWT77037.1 hydrolase [Achromobacter sp. HZ28]OWT77918.1 hydrolase [Achromobacter sp. HZ34]